MLPFLRFYFALACFISDVKNNYFNRPKLIRVTYIPKKQIQKKTEFLILYQFGIQYKNIRVTYQMHCYDRG